MTAKVSGREFPFIPRIINPIRIGQVVVFAGETLIRRAARDLVEEMPWIQIEVLRDPGTASSFKADGAVVFILDDTALPLVDTDMIRENNRDAVVVLLTANPRIQCSPPGPARERYPYTARADLVFASDTTEYVPRVIMAPVVRAAEDLINIRADLDVRRFIFLVVDDEPRWLSQFLPVLYSIIAQRADVMVTRTYEEALQFLFVAEDEADIDPETMRRRGHARDVVFLITDIFFPRGDEPESDAGRDLIRLVDHYYPRIPIVIASKADEAEAFRGDAFLLPKGDPGSLEELSEHIRNHSGMGDLLVRGDGDEILRRIQNIFDLYEMILTAEKDDPKGRELRSIIENHAEKDRFSTWLYMHGYRELADRLRPRHTRGSELISLLKKNLEIQIQQLRATPLIIDDTRVYSITDLLKVLRSASEDAIQPLSDNDVFSSWLDRQGYSELAEELRPIHGSGSELSRILIAVLEKWHAIYQERGDPHLH
jgi:hypothetical protein